jgi:hypothetical protein
MDNPSRWRCVYTQKWATSNWNFRCSLSTDLNQTTFRESPSEKYRECVSVCKYVQWRTIPRTHRRLGFKKGTIGFVYALDQDDGEIAVRKKGKLCYSFRSMRSNHFQTDEPPPLVPTCQTRKYLKLGRTSPSSRHGLVQIAVSEKWQIPRRFSAWRRPRR